MKNWKIILIDDCAEILLFMKDVLKSYEVLSFTSPMQVLRYIEGTDLIMLDYAMPEMDGLEFLKFLRDNFPDVSVIMITGHGSERICQEAFRIGIKDYIIKPFSASNLKETVERVIARKSPLEKSPDQINPEILDGIYKAKLYIDKNLDKRLRIQEVLKIACMSKGKFNIYFKQLNGSPFKTYVLNKKVEKSKELLRKGLSITQVSDMLGFTDSSHFTKQFKKITGHLPSDV